jgi:hypothetical protein
LTNTGLNQEIQLGAGPLVTLDNGIQLGDSDFFAAQNLAPGDDRFPNDGYAWRPELDAAGANSSAGADLCDGQYFDDVQLLQTGVDPSEYHLEGDQYDRNDFTLSVDPTDPAKSDAFLARLRRSNEVLPAGATAGPTLPYLFFRGSGAGKGLDDLKALSQGMTVRATSIAQWSPLTAVNFPVSFQGLLDQTAKLQTIRNHPLLTSDLSASFALTDQFWTASTDQDATLPSNPVWKTTAIDPMNPIQDAYQQAPLTQASDGLSLQFKDPNNMNQMVAGYFFPMPTDNAAFSAKQAVIGAQLPDQTQATSVTAVTTPAEGFASIVYTMVETNPGQVALLGFAYVVVTPTAAPNWTITRYLARVARYDASLEQVPVSVPVSRAAVNASASLSAIRSDQLGPIMQAVDLPTAVQGRDRITFDPTTWARLPSAPYLLSAPASVRSTQ